MIKYVSHGLIALVLLSWTAYSQTTLESMTGKFSVSIERTGSAKTWPESNQWTASVMMADGAELYRIEKEVPFDFQFPAIYLTDLDGSAVVVSSAQGVIEWYSPKGQTIAALYPFGHQAPDYERVIKCSIGGDRAAFLISSPEMSAARIISMTMTGEKVWTVEFPLQHAGEVLMSPSGRYVLAGAYASEGEIVKKTYVIGNEGKIIRELPGMFRYAAIDEESGTIAYAERNNVTIAGIHDDGGREWRTGKRETIITSLQFIEGDVLATVESVSVEGGLIRYVNPSLVLLDEQAKVVAEKSFQSISAKPVNARRRGENIVLEIGGLEKEIKLSEVLPRR